jgi:hypothetical protein
MQYEKPEVIKVVQAAASIQSSMVKREHITLDSNFQEATTPAYEADE